MVGRIVVSRLGGPEVLAWSDVEVGAPGPHEVRLRHTAVGVNFIDVYFRTGLYPAGSVPFALGMEAAGVVDAVGADVESLKVGDRVAYASGPLGSYSEARLMPAERVVLLPAGIDDKTGAAMMLKGMTAEYLLHRTYPVKRGDAVLVHAAAGGVGRILCQWAKHLGATVIGTVGSDEKARLAAESGCDHPILYSREDVAKRVREITGGAGVAVAYDSVGKDTFTASLDSLAPRGMLALYGQSSGPVGPFDPQLLNQKGSLFLTRPSLIHYTGTRADLVESASRLFSVVESGAVEIHIGQTYALRDAARAHADLEARKTTGSTVLLPAA
jgi:NADPH2:quinone reductase